MVGSVGIMGFMQDGGVVSRGRDMVSDRRDLNGVNYG